MPTTETKRGLLLPCPLCGEGEAQIMLNLADLETCRCTDCDEEFTLSDVRNLLAKWARVLEWVGTVPGE